MEIFESEKTMVKSVGDRYFKVTMTYDRKGVFHILSENLLTHKERKSSFIDYNMANFTFETQVSLYRGH